MTAATEETTRKLPEKSVRWLKTLDLSLFNPAVEPAKSLCASESAKKHVSDPLAEDLRQLHTRLSALQAKARETNVVEVPVAQRDKFVGDVRTMSNTEVTSRFYQGAGLPLHERERLGKLKRTLETATAEVWNIANALAEEPIKLQSPSLFARRR